MTDYNPFAKTFSESRKNMKWKELDAIIEDIQKNNFQNILDIGCGNGRFLENFLSIVDNSSVNYVWVDASEEMLIEAKKLYKNHNFYVSTMQDFLSKLSTKIDENVEVVELKENQKISNKKIFQKFDAIIFLASFHHLKSEKERIEVLQNAKKMLSENGKIYLTNWNLLPQEKYKKNHIWNGDFDIKIWNFSRYYHGFDLEELGEIFQKSELFIEKNEIFEWWRNIFSILAKNFSKK